MGVTVELLLAEIGITAPTDRKSATAFVGLLDLLADPPAEINHWLPLSLEQVSVRRQLAEQARDYAEHLGSLKAALFTCFQPQLLELPGERLLERFRGPYSWLSRWFNHRYWRDLRQLRTYAQRGRLNYVEAVSALSRAVEILHLQAWFQAHQPSFEDRLGPPYRGDETDWKALCEKLAWLERFRHLLPSDSLPAGILAHLRNPGRLRPIIVDARTELRSQLTT